MELFVSQNVPHEIHYMIRDRIGVKAVESISKYLGLPASIGMSKKEIFLAIKEIINSKLK